MHVAVYFTANRPWWRMYSASWQATYIPCCVIVIRLWVFDWRCSFDLLFGMRLSSGLKERVVWYCNHITWRPRHFLYLAYVRREERIGWAENAESYYCDVSQPPIPCLHCGVITFTWLVMLGLLLDSFCKQDTLLCSIPVLIKLPSKLFNPEEEIDWLSLHSVWYIGAVVDQSSFSNTTNIPPYERPI
jgi:hypothetical protein